jgi:hypothetical protein
MAVSPSRAPEGNALPHRARLLGISLLLLMLGLGLAYTALFLRWSYYIGPPIDPSRLIPEDRASLTVHLWDATNNLLWTFPCYLACPGLPHGHAAARGGRPAAAGSTLVERVQLAEFAVRRRHGADSGDGLLRARMDE